MLLRAFLLLPYLLISLFYSERFSEGRIQYAVLALLLAAEAALAYFVHPAFFFAGFLLTLFLFLFFYAKEPRHPDFLPSKIQHLLLGFLLYLPWIFLPPAFGIPAAALSNLLYLLGQAGLLKAWSGAALALFYLLTAAVRPLSLLYALDLSAFGLLFAISVLTRQRAAEAGEKEIAAALLGYTEDVRAMHLQMRSWRHDFHNHLQSMKFLLKEQKYEETRRYLDELEQDLSSVDTMVKSGRLSVDAILNSKLSLAKEAGIRLDVTVYPLPKLGISDVDLTALLGNLLDNAIEACEKIPEERRFIRLYLDCVGQQLYFSIQNSAKESLSFNERHYISEKRGRHGLGMKRVKLLVDKYGGILNLQNEAGVFAAELSFALPESSEDGPPSAENLNLGE